MGKETSGDSEAMEAIELFLWFCFGCIVGWCIMEFFTGTYTKWKQ